MDHLVAGEQGHALFRAGQQQGLDADVGAQTLDLGTQLVLVAPAAHHLGQLCTVGRDDGGARVAPVVAALGVDQHRLAGGAGQLDHARDVRQAALAVVREQHQIVMRQLNLELVQHLAQHLVVGLVLEVDADQLLGAADDAQLHDGVELRIVTQRGLHAACLQQLAQLARGLVLADHGEQRGTRPQGLDVECHIGGTAQALFLALHPHHRHRRLGGNAVHGAVPVAVQHHIAHHQHAALGQLGRHRRLHGAQVRRAHLSPDPVRPRSHRTGCGR